MNLQFLADGLITGSLIGLGAIGVTLTYSILRFCQLRPWRPDGLGGLCRAHAAGADLGPCR